MRTLLGILLLGGFFFLLMEKEKETISDSEELEIEKLECEVQLFELSGQDGGEIIGYHGTHLFFSPNSFMDKNGNIVLDTIDIQLIEFHVKESEGTFYSPATASDHAILTNGYFELTAFYNNEELTFHSDVDLASILLK